MTDRSAIRLRRPLGAAFLVLMTVLAYWPAIRHGGFIWDDEDNITENPLLRSPSGLRDIWTRVGESEGGTIQYYPLTYTSFWLEYRLWGLAPAGYHLTNVLLHGLNAVLLWLILLRLRVPGALLAAAVFALHPVHVESVAWITERKNVLSGLFYFLSLLSFLRFFGLDENEEQKPPSRLAGARSSYYLGLALFACALASKTATVTLPAAVLLLLWWKTGRIGWRNAALTVPLFLLAFLSGLVTVYVEKYPGGAMGGEWTLSAVEHVLLAGRIVWSYAGKLLWPQPLMFVYPRWEMNQAAWAQYLFPLALAAVISALWLFRERTGRGPLAAALFFIGTLAPVLGFLDVYFMRFSYVADHFQYLASPGVIVLLAAGAALSWRRYGTGRSVPVYALASAPLLALFVLTWRQSGLYASEEKIWSDTIRKNPSAWLAYSNLGVLFSHQGRHEEAIAHYREAISVKPDYPEAYNNMGVSLAALGRRKEAVSYYREALRIKPDYPEAHYNWGVSLAAQGKMAEAAVRYGAALRISPDYPEAHNNLGVALAALGRTAEAIVRYRAALRVQPDYPVARYNWGLALAAAGRKEEAIEQYRLAPGLPESRNDWCFALSTLGRTEEALAQCLEALRLRPDFPEARNNLGLALMSLGKIPEAAGQYREALRLRPDYPEAHNRLGVALSALGRTEEAITHYRAAVRLRPADLEARNNLCLALASLGRKEEAAEQYRELLRLRPDFRAAYYDLGAVLAAQGLFDVVRDSVPAAPGGGLPE